MTADAEALLFTTLDGTRVEALEEVIYDGLDHDYSARVPALERLLDAGEPRDRLFACAMLAAWGVPAGLQVVAIWARTPAIAPWVRDAAAFEPSGGGGDSFELLAETIRISKDARGRDATTDAYRADAARALLASYERIELGRRLFEALSLDEALSEAVREDLAPAIERSIETARRDDVGFDLQVQAASLLGALAALDDPRTAELAAALAEEPPRASRVRKEIAYAMRFGTGPATLAVLDDLAKSAHASVREEAIESLGERRLRDTR